MPCSSSATSSRAGRIPSAFSGVSASSAPARSSATTRNVCSQRALAKRRAEAAPKLEPSHEELLTKLEDEDWAQLESLPLRITLDDHGIWIVHGGLVPGIPFEKQDPWMVTHIRSISEDGEPSSKRGPLWGARWQGPPHVVFGHNARKNPQLHPHATGIDTACVYGEHLTALVLPEGSEVPPPKDRPDAARFRARAPGLRRLRPTLE